MKTNPVTNTWGTDAVGLLPVCVGFFVVADLLLIGRAWFLEDDRLLLAMALPLSQCSLAAIWAACSRVSPYVRFAVPLLGVVGCWYLLTKILPWGIGGPASAAWALALTIQVMAIMMAIHLYRLATSRVSPSEVDANRPKRSRLSYDLQTLMLWTTVIALGFGFIQFGRARWLWTQAVADWEFLDAMPFIGILNAVLAILWLWALAAGSWQWRGAKIAMVILLIGCIGASCSHLADWATGTTVLGVRDTLVLAAAQSCLLASSLAVTITPPTQTP